MSCLIRDYIYGPFNQRDDCLFYKNKPIIVNDIFEDLIFKFKKGVGDYTMPYLYMLTTRRILTKLMEENKKVWNPIVNNRYVDIKLSTFKLC